MKNIITLSVLLFTMTLPSLIFAQGTKIKNPLEMTPSIEQNLRLTLVENGSEKKLVLKTKKSNKQADHSQLFYFEFERRANDYNPIYSIKTKDKSGADCYLTTKPLANFDGKIVFENNKPNLGWKLRGNAIMLESGEFCWTFGESPTDNTALNIVQCNPFSGQGSDPHMEQLIKDYNKTLDFLNVEKIEQMLLGN